MHVADAAAVATEVEAQLAAFRGLVGREPTHLDSHQHVHLVEPARAVLRDAARRLGVPLRSFAEGIRYCGDFYGQTRTGASLPARLTVAALLRILRSLPDGITELACHPAAEDDGASAYGAERVRECETLCDARIARAIDALGIRVCNFADAAVAGVRQPAPS